VSKRCHPCSAAFGDSITAETQSIIMPTEPTQKWLRIPLTGLMSGYY
jgi:hypothetical protein